MKRRLRIGTISPRKGCSFGSTAASYPPPSAFSTHPKKRIRKPPAVRATYSLLETPEHFSGFWKNFGHLNGELGALHSDPGIPSEIKVALDVGVSSLNSLAASDASDIGNLPHSRQYIASLKLSGHYEKLICEFLNCARSRDLGGMLKTANVLGINLPKLLYKRGIYLKLGKESPVKSQKSFK